MELSKPVPPRAATDAHLLIRDARGAGTAPRRATPAPEEPVASPASPTSREAGGNAAWLPTDDAAEDPLR